MAQDILDGARALIAGRYDTKMPKRIPAKVLLGISVSPEQKEPIIFIGTLKEIRLICGRRSFCRGECDRCDGYRDRTCGEGENRSWTLFGPAEAETKTQGALA